MKPKGQKPDSLRAARKRKRTPPPLYEWDFEKVPENERDWCALWEYAREAKWVAKEVKKWLSTRFRPYVPVSMERPYKLRKQTKGPFGPIGEAGKTVLETLGKPDRTRDDCKSCLDAFPVTLEWGARKPPEPLPDRYPTVLRRFCQLVVELPEFPAPWLKIDANERQKAVENLASMDCQAFGDNSPAPFMIEEFDEGVERIRLARVIMRRMWSDWPAPEDHRHYVLTVDWDECTNEDAVGLFKAWLKKNPHRKRHRGGRRTGEPIARERLQSLATLRWKVAGFQFTTAKSAIAAMGLRHSALVQIHSKTSSKVLDVTHDVWRHRFKSAERALSTLFPPPARNKGA